MQLKNILLLVLVMVSGTAMAQEIRGIVTDSKTSWQVVNAMVEISQNDFVKGGQTTDYDGGYYIKGLPAGKYSIVVKYHGYTTLKITNVPLANNATELNIVLTPGNSDKTEVKKYKKTKK